MRLLSDFSGVPGSLDAVVRIDLDVVVAKLQAHTVAATERDRGPRALSLSLRPLRSRWRESARRITCAHTLTSNCKRAFVFGQMQTQ